MPAAPTDLLGERGEVLFHYTTLARAVEDILPTMRMKMSPFAESGIRVNRRTGGCQRLATATISIAEGGATGSLPAT
jgi:hypothetical protein